MIDLFLLFGLIIAFGLSAFLLTSRKKRWCTDKFRFTLTGLLFIFGLFGKLIFENLTENQESFLIWLQVPLINSLFDRLFKYLSFKIHKRDLLLYVRGSSDLDCSGKNPNMKTSDYLFSILLVIFMFLLPLFGL